MRFLRRLPTYFPNLKIHMMPLTEQELKQVKDTGWLPKVAFRTTPQTNKIEIKSFLESMYKMKVKKVHTLNYDGKKKRTKNGMVQQSAWKKAYVFFQKPEDSADQKK
ncbi:hypothetical protein BSKO_00613 [Bryopsis sp. KO-2023]|nr:hypothetical protein BSKO_00613 [Bryopsis sp. KO-2023]